MRITNGIMVQNSLNNINTNKVLMDRLNTQLATQKKIQKPSEDPIVAIRALRLRTTQSEIEQFLKKNIPDARSWMETTEEALNKVEEMVSDITQLCNQGINDYYDETNRNTLLQTLKQYSEQIYKTGDADYAGRTIFTGYKTDKTLTFEEDKPDASYLITQQFTFRDIESVSKITGSVNANTVAELTEDSVSNNSVNRIRLAYDNISQAASVLTIVPPEAGLGITFLTRSIANDGDSVYQPGDFEVIMIEETGELVFGDSAAEAMKEASSIGISYTKDGFLKGDLRPEHYFDSIDQSSADPADYVYYTKENQEINYTVNFNQTLSINTQAKDTLTHDIRRDIDDISDAVNIVINATSKVDLLKRDIDNSNNETTKKTLQTMLAAAELELSYAKDNMGKAFERGLTKFQAHEDRMTLSIADLGARMKRLDLNETRLEAQLTSVKELKSSNEDADLTQVAVEFKVAESVYDASLAASAKVVKKTLLDFI